jgi:hypothetical protein
MIMAASMKSMRCLLMIAMIMKRKSPSMSTQRSSNQLSPKKLMPPPSCPSRFRCWFGFRWMILPSKLSPRQKGIVFSLLE